VMSECCRVLNVRDKTHEMQASRGWCPARTACRTRLQQSHQHSHADMAACPLPQRSSMRRCSQPPTDCRVSREIVFGPAFQGGEILRKCWQADRMLDAGEQAWAVGAHRVSVATAAAETRLWSSRDRVEERRGTREGGDMVGLGRDGTGGRTRWHAGTRLNSPNLARAHMGLLWTDVRLEKWHGRGPLVRLHAVRAHILPHVHTRAPPPSHSRPELHAALR
jgi:hypothetical protein